MSPNDSYPQHVVTAVIVAHDGAGWLAHGLDALSSQTKPVQRVVAVDTGSRDRSGSVLAAKLGQAAVFGMDRSTGYAAAVRRAVQHKAASAPVPGGPQGRGRTSDQVEWLWLLHDDCEPAPDALEQLLRGAAETQSAAVLGPKLMDWTNRAVIVEAGLTLDTVGRRITGVEPGEVDQGQHDGDRDTLAVGSAGMLVRRDVWEQVGGFDPGMTLFGEDIDFCWRVHAAGYRVRVITDAVVNHARAATQGRRAISVGRRARLLDRRNGLVTLLGNLPFGQMLVSLAGNLALSFLRTLFYLVAKRPSAALDESAAVLGVVGHPVRLAKIRHRRAPGRRQAYGRLRGDLPPGRSIRRAAEFAAMMMSRSSEKDVAGTRHATDDPTDDEWLLTDTGFLQRVLTRPGVLVVLGLIAVAIAAERSVVTAGTLGGGALLPAWEGASGLWSQFLQAFHPTGIGSASSGLPYVGLLAVPATVLGGKPWLAIDVLLLACVPLAGVTAILALRKVTKSVPVRVWAAASYALLPVAFGAVAGGRLGSAVAFVMIPLIGLLAGRMFCEPPKLARRAAWATGLAITVGAAFVPLLWLLALAGAVLAATLYRAGRGMLVNLAIAALTPLVLLMPWLLQLLEHPSLLLLEAGVQRPGLAAGHLPARSLLLLSPGGPGLPPYWVSGALVLAGLLALLATRRRRLVVSGWCVALLGLAAALAVSRVTVTPPGGQPMTPWPGVPLAVAAAGLLLAAAAAASDLGGLVAAGGRRGRRLGGLRSIPVAVLALCAFSAPLLAAGYWLVHGVTGPLAPATGQIVPSLVSQTGGSGRQLRTLVLTTSRGHVSYLLLRGGSPQFSDPGLRPVGAAHTALNGAVAALVAPGGGEAADQSQLLARFDIGFVLMRAPVSDQLASVLDGVAGLTAVSTTSSFDLWRLTDLPSRVSVVEPNGTVVAIPSGQVGVSATVPAAGGTLELAEPAGDWSAALNGHALSPVASPAGSWAQAFTLPPGGGTLTVSRNGLVHDLLVVLEIMAFLVVAALALPGVRTAAELEATAAGAGSAEQVAESAEDEVAVGAGRHSARDYELVPDEQPGMATAARGAAGPRTAAAAGAAAGTAAGSRGTRSGRGHGSKNVARRADGKSRQDRKDRARGDERVASKDDGRKDSARKDSARKDSARKDSARKDKRRGGRLAMPSRDRGSAGRTAAAVAGTAGAAAAAAGAAAAGPATANSATAGRAAANPATAAAARAAGAGSIPGPLPGTPAAWPADQPASTFMARPPDSPMPPAPYGPGRPGPNPYQDDDNQRYDPRAARAGSGPRSPSGTPYEEPPGRGPTSAPVPGYGARSPSGARYQDELDGDSGYAPPGHRSDAGYGPRYRDDPGYRDGSTGYGDAAGRHGASGTHGAGPGYGSDSGYGTDGRYGGEPPYRSDAEYRGDAGNRGAGYREDSGYGQGGYPGDRSPRSLPPAAAPDWQDSGWHEAPAGHDPANREPGPAQYASGWPEPDARHGWSRDNPEQAWPQEQTAAGPVGHGSSWPVPEQQLWADQAEELEALPSPGEVHHDWPGREDRAGRGWPAPGHEADGETR